VIFIILYLKERKSPKKELTYELTKQTQCLTSSEDKKECKTCNPGDKLQEGKCILNHSFKAVYRTKSPKEKVTLFNIPHEIVTEMIIDNNKIKPEKSFVFPESGEHTLYALIDMNRCFTLGGMFNGNKHLISIEFSPIFNTEKINEMNFMFQNCKSLTSVDVSNLNTKNVAFMEYMFAGCSSLKTLDVRNFNTENVEKMNSVFQGCSSLESIDLSSFNTTNVNDMSDMFVGCSSLKKENIKIKNKNDKILNELY
jgi:surface protein